MTATLCLLFALIIESCIQSGLIPSNTGYAQLFAASTISAQITDQNGKCIYQSQGSEYIVPKIAKQVIQRPVMSENGIRLSGKPIWGGYVIEEENLRTKKQVEKLSVQNQLYDKIQKQTARQSTLLAKFMEAYAMEENEKERKKILGKIVVIGAYIKRRSNLILIAEDAMQIYDFLEAVIEESLEDLSAFTLNLKRRDEEILMSLSVECKTNLQKVAGRYQAYAEQDFDGAWLLSLVLKGGHDKL